MPNGKQQGHQNTAGNLLLNRNDGQNRCDKTEGAGTGKRTVRHAQTQRSQKPLKFQAVEKAAAQGASFDSKHAEADPDQHQAYQNLPVIAYIAQHAAQNRTDNADRSNTDKEAGGEYNRVLHGLKGLWLFLAAYICDHQWDGGQVAGTEEYAHHPPQKTSQQG